MVLGSPGHTMTGRASRNEELARCISALHAIEIISDAYASSEKSAALITEIATALAFRRSEMGKYGGICQQVSDAIHRGLLNHEPPPLKP